jgi:hypothetical protein
MAPRALATGVPLKNAELAEMMSKKRTEET